VLLILGKLMFSGLQCKLGEGDLKKKNQ